MKRTRSRQKVPARRDPKRVPTKKVRSDSRSERHPVYGEIPLIEVVRRDVAGREVRGLDYDPDYSPPMPRGAVRGDVRKQHFCPMCHVPRYFYVDQERKCVECHRGFVFSGGEQKYWYEELKFHFDSVAIRCRDCRKRQRARRSLHAAVARTRARMAASPLDPRSALEVAEAIVRLSELTGEGDLAEAISIARKAARRLAPTDGLQGEASFWEGKAQALGGRHERAKVLLASAREALPRNKRGAALRAEADWYLTSESTAGPADG